MDYLYQIFLLLPLLNFLVIFLKKGEGEIDMNFSLSVSKLLSLISLAFLIGISTRQNVNITSLFSFNEYFTLKFIFNKGSILIAYAIAIMWVSLLFYVEKIHEVKGLYYDINSFLKYLPISILAINMLNFSFTIYSAIFFYSIAILLFLIILLKHLTSVSPGREIFYKAFFLSQILMLFVVLVLAGKYSAVVDAANGTFPLEHSSRKASSLIFGLLCTILLVNFIAPIFYIFRNKVNNENFNILTGFFINFGIAQILFLKYLAEIFFGIGIFSDLLGSYAISIVQTTFICSIIASLVLLVFTKNISKIFFLILYNQISLTMLAVFVDFMQDGVLTSGLIFAFIMFIVLFFMVLNNLILYMECLKISDLSGSFSHFKINIIIVGFCFLNLASLFPPAVLNSVDLILLTRELKFNTTTLVIVTNSVVLLLIGLKILLPTLQFDGRDEEGERDDDLADQQEAGKIDFSSKLTLTPAVIMFTMAISSFLI